MSKCTLLFLNFFILITVNQTFVNQTFVKKNLSYIYSNLLVFQLLQDWCSRANKDDYKQNREPYFCESNFCEPNFCEPIFLWNYFFCFTKVWLTEIWFTKVWLTEIWFTKVWFIKVWFTGIIKKIMVHIFP